MTDNSSLFLVLRLRGGQDSEETERQSDSEWPDNIDLDWSSDEENEQDDGSASGGDGDDEGDEENGYSLFDDFEDRDHGGNEEAVEVVEERKQHYPLTPLTDLPDMITWDDDKTFLRARMPCGHAIGQYAIYICN
jgi:hypothetical protein